MTRQRPTATTAAAMFSWVLNLDGVETWTRSVASVVGMLLLLASLQARIIDKRPSGPPEQ
jgi:hypothetical protein